LASTAGARGRTCRRRARASVSGARWSSTAFLDHRAISLRVIDDRKEWLGRHRMRLSESFWKLSRSGCGPAARIDKRRDRLRAKTGFARLRRGARGRRARRRTRKEGRRPIRMRGAARELFGQGERFRLAVAAVERHRAVAQLNDAARPVKRPVLARHGSRQLSHTSPSPPESKGELRPRFPRLQRLDQAPRRLLAG